jgi:TolB-like protein
MPPGDRKSPPPSRDEILAQRDRLLATPVFRRSPNSLRLLRFLVDRLLDHPRADTSQYTLAFEVLALDKKFDADRNPVVRMQVARVRRALANHYVGPGLLDPLRITLPAGSYRLRIERASTSPRKTRTRIPAPVVALLEFRGLGLPGVWSHLPGVIAEELSLAMGHLPGLRVLGPFSRARLEQEGIEAVDVARRHGADFTLDGSLEVQGRQALLRVRLLDGATGFQVWSARHLLKPGRRDLATFQTDLLQRLSLEVGADFGPLDAHLSALAKVKPAASLEIHEAVVTARAYFHEFSLTLLRRSLTALRKAVAAHPDEAVPKATLSLVLVSTLSHSEWTKPIPLAEIDALAHAAYVLDPSSPWSIQALVAAAGLGGRDSEIDALAQRLDGPQPFSSQLKGSMGLWMVLRRVRVDDGLGLVRQAIAANPHHLPILHQALALDALGRGDIPALHQALDAFGWPKGWFAPLLRAAAHALEGQPGPAAAALASAKKADPLLKTHGLGRLQAYAHPDHTRAIGAALSRVGLRLPAVRLPAGFAR